MPEIIKWPMGDASTIVPDFVTPVAINNDMTFLRPAQINADRTLDLVIAAGVRAGAIIHLKVKATTDGQDVSFGTGFASPSLVGVTGKTKVMSFIYDGTYFYPLAPSLQID
jgi:hypothetical protein